ncbi:hypothetical protein L798_00136, partial [Zootermopsis nevadensis]
AADQNFDYMFKLLIIGNSSVGKTSFLFRYADDSFTSAFVSTVGIDFKVKTVFRHDKRVKLQIWVQLAPKFQPYSKMSVHTQKQAESPGLGIKDCSYPTICNKNAALRLNVLSPQDTAGQERYRTITTAYYRGANVNCFVEHSKVLEASNRTLQVTQIKTYSWDNAQVILVGNKCDMEDERVISYERGKQLAEQLGIEFFETSAKENINVKVILRPMRSQALVKAGL